MKRKIQYNKNSLKKRYEESYDSRTKGYIAGRSIIDWHKVADDLGKEPVFYKPKEGWNKIIIVPFIISSKKHPGVVRKKYEIGDLDYFLDIFVHRRIGLGKDDIVCPQATFGKPCPICQLAEQKKQEGLKEEYQRLKPTRRVLYNVIDLKDLDAGLQIFEVSYFLFEKELVSASKNYYDDGEIVNFADPEEGSIIKFRAENETFKRTGKDYLVYKNFSFLERQETIDDDLIAEAVAFDKYLNVLDYDEIVGILDNANASVEDEEEQNFEEENKFDEKPKQSKLSKFLHKSRDIEEDETEEEEEEEKPTRKLKKHTNENKKLVCPYGHKFGFDCDAFADCDNCPLWEQCSLYNSKLK